MGGKSSTSKSTVTIPPEVLARYNSVNNYAQQVAQTPFQSYSSDPNAFVAPINAQEQQGIGATNAYANAAQPFYNQAGQQLLSAQSSAVPFYGQAQGSLAGAQTIGNLLGSSSYSALANAQNAAQPFNYAAGQDYNTAYGAAQPYNSGATGLALAGSQAVNPNQIDANAISQFLSPYLGTVLGSTASLLNQNNQQQQAGQLGNAINSGAFGGDRAGIAAANLAQQQNLANANIYSNIANQGFNTALGAAQQQQGVNLGAQQANRAALQEAANEILGIGQQQYSQGMGLGQAQQGLGQQIFGQGTTLGQALAALGQQQFGQGLSASQQQAALGQGLYGMGSATSQGLANLGTAAQTAGLQGAQAQLAAGQLQQQTQQAGLSALYNQFLQQQSYPFQVAQFLANIAEGTGALSGSTTTTTQPGGFFSDERLKENIRPVGKTFDGQKIYAYNYKGEPRTQVGLLAQEVEKKHPEAVGGHLGYKTVDYGAATDKAAARGKFAEGGTIGKAEGGILLPGLDPTFMQMILQANAQSHGPYGNAGLYGGSASGEPRGGSSYVPSASLPVGNLTVASPPTEAPKSGLSQIKDIASAADTIKGGIGAIKGKGSSKLTDFSNKSIDDMKDLPVDTGFDDRIYNVGGRAHKAGGGMNDDEPIETYADQFGPKLKIPNVHSNLKLAQADPPSQQGGGGLGDILGIAGSIGSLFGLASGGAAHKADGGDVFTPDDRGDPRTLAFLKRLLANDDDDVPAPTGLGVVPFPPSTNAAPSASLATKPGSPASIAAILAAEGTGKNPNSSARGVGQIIDSTFKRTFRQMFPDQAKGMSDNDILSLRNGPKADDLYQQMIPYIHSQNLAALGRAGLDPTAGNAYLAWFLGPQGAVKTLKADPNTPISDLIPQSAINANGRILSGKTAGQVADWATRLMHKKGARSGGRIGFDDGGGVNQDLLDTDAAPTVDPTKKALEIVAKGRMNDAANRINSDRNELSGAVPIGKVEPDTEAYSAQPISDPTNLLPPGLGAAQSPQHHGLLAGLGQRIERPNGRPDLLLPILQGIAAMGTAPTRHLGVALAAGLGAGASGYIKQREIEQEQQRIAQNQQLVSANVAQRQLQALGFMLQRFDGQYQYRPTNPDAPWYNLNTGTLESEQEHSRKRMAVMDAGTSRQFPGSPLNLSVNDITGGTPTTSPSMAAVPASPSPISLSSSTPHPEAAPKAIEQPTVQSLVHKGTAVQKAAAGDYGAQSFYKIPQIDESSIAPENRLSTLIQKRQEAASKGLTEAASALDQRINSYNSQPITDANGNLFYGYVENAASRAAAAERAKAGMDLNNGISKDAATFFQSGYPNAKQILNSLGNLYQHVETNRLSGSFSNFIGEMRSIPGIGELVSDYMKEYQSTTDAAKKGSIQQAMTRAIESGLGSRAPAATLTEALLTVADPSMSPGARYKIWNQANAQLERQKDMFTDWTNNKDQILNPSLFMHDWNAESNHNINAYEKRSYAQSAPFKGMTDAEIAQHPRSGRAPRAQDMKEGHVYPSPKGPVIMRNGMLYPLSGNWDTNQ